MTKKEPPAFQFYASDWLGSTKIALMTPAQRGAYIHLLAHAWGSKDKSLPDNDAQLARLSGLGDDWPANAELIRSCFKEGDGKLFNLRLKDIAKEQRKYVKAKRAAGMASGKARRQNKMNAEQNSNTTRTKTNSPTPSPTPSPSPSPSPPPSPSPSGKERDSEESLVRLADEWNAMASKAGLPKVIHPDKWSSTSTRRETAMARLSEATFRESYREAIQKIPDCSFLCGDNDRGWKANLGWFLKPDSVSKLIEEEYDYGNNRPKDLSYGVYDG